jgi:hypothetical protein
MGVEWLLFLVLMMGVGLGSAAAAWATRHSEMVVRVSGQEVVFEGDPTQEQMAYFQWLMAYFQWLRKTEEESSTDPYTEPFESAPAQ